MLWQERRPYPGIENRIRDCLHHFQILLLHQVVPARRILKRKEVPEQQVPLRAAQAHLHWQIII